MLCVGGSLQTTGWQGCCVCSGARAAGRQKDVVCVIVWPVVRVEMFEMGWVCAPCDAPAQVLECLPLTL